MRKLILAIFLLTFSLNTYSNSLTSSAKIEYYKKKKPKHKKKKGLVSKKCKGLKAHPNFKR